MTTVRTLSLLGPTIPRRKRLDSGIEPLLLDASPSETLINAQDIEAAAALPDLGDDSKTAQSLRRRLDNDPNPDSRLEHWAPDNKPAPLLPDDPGALVDKLFDEAHLAESDEADALLFPETATMPELLYLPITAGAGRAVVLESTEETMRDLLPAEPRADDAPQS